MPVQEMPLLPGTLKNLFYPPEKDEYTYFASARTYPFAGADKFVKAAWAADASTLAYARYGKQPMSEDDFKENLQRGGLTDYTKIGDWAAPGTQGYFASNEHFAMLAFRGTEIDDAVAKFDDVDIVLVHEPDYRTAPGEAQPALGHLSVIEHLFSLPCLVHRGFQRALNQVWDQVHGCVTAYRQKFPHAEICFTGHSLGAALAVLAFSRFADAGISLFTVGCPRVGDQAFVKRALSGQSRGAFRFVNLNDPVAHIPLESCFYRHAPQECYRFDQDGNLGTDDGRFKGDVDALRVAIAGLPGDFRSGLEKIQAPAGVVDHSPARYSIRLWNWVTREARATA
jgi:hypothetical protein